MTALLEVENLTVALPTRAGYRNAVDDLSLTVNAGEVVGIAGESGSGKTMTALSLFGLLPPGARVTGSARLDGTDLLALRGRRLRDVRGRQVAMVSQDPTAALHPIPLDSCADGEGIERTRDGNAIGAGVHKCPGQHVPGQSGERIDVTDRHGYFSLGDRVRTS